MTTYSASHKNYYNENKEVIQNKLKQYNENNPGKFLESRQKKYIINSRIIKCEFCNCETASANYAKHKRSKKHLRNAPVVVKEVKENLVEPLKKDI